MSFGSRRNIFLGANTRYGFKSLYETLLTDYDNYNLTVYILKGGPGTGKSTFVKKSLVFLIVLAATWTLFIVPVTPKAWTGLSVLKAGLQLWMAQALI